MTILKNEIKIKWTLALGWGKWHCLKNDGLKNDGLKNDELKNDVTKKYRIVVIIF